MSGSRKALKVICILLIIYAILQIVLGAFMLFGASIPDFATQSMIVNGTEAALSTLALISGAFMIIAGLLNLIIGMLGVRGANNPQKIGIFFVLAIVGAILGLVGLGMSIAQGTFDIYSLISLIVVVLCAILANNIKKEKV